MTFPEQIVGVPPALVEQGWRLPPSIAIYNVWARAGGLLIGYPKGDER